MLVLCFILTSSYWRSGADCCVWCSGVAGFGPRMVQKCWEPQKVSGSFNIKDMKPFLSIRILHYCIEHGWICNVSVFNIHPVPFDRNIADVWCTFCCNFCLWHSWCWDDISQVLSYIQKMVNQWLTHNGLLGRLVWGRCLSTYQSGIEYDRINMVGLHTVIYCIASEIIKKKKKTDCEASHRGHVKRPRFSCGVADIIANDQTLLNVERTLKQVNCLKPERGAWQKQFMNVYDIVSVMLCLRLFGLEIM